MAQDIPTRSRTIVAQRENGRCLRCGSGRPAEWAHRRARSVPGEHRNCPCNGTHLCHTCHHWCHQHPKEARARGFMVNADEGHPGSVAVHTWYGVLYLECDGDIRFHIEED